MSPEAAMQILYIFSTANEFESSFEVIIYTSSASK
jgi:hypothetical protein